MAFRKTHPGTALGIIISTAGASIPFGFESGGYSYHVTDFEWALTAVSIVALVGLVLRYLNKLGRWGDNFILLTAAVWVAAAVYVGVLDPKQTWRWRLGFTLICLGIAVNALFAYVREARDFG